MNRGYTLMQALMSSLSHIASRGLGFRRSIWLSSMVSDWGVSSLGTGSRLCSL